MAKKRKKNNTITTYDLLKSQRGSWGEINPVTKVIKSKKIYNRKKNKIKLED